MSNWDEVRGNIQTIGTRIASLEGVDPNLRETLGHALTQIISMIGMIIPIGDTVHRGRQEMQMVRDTINQIQGRVDNMAQQSGGTQRRHGILESKATANIKTLISDKTTFRSWNEKLINALAQALGTSWRT